MASILSMRKTPDSKGAARLSAFRTGYESPRCMPGAQLPGPPDSTRQGQTQVACRHCRTGNLPAFFAGRWGAGTGKRPNPRLRVLKSRAGRHQPEKQAWEPLGKRLLLRKAMKRPQPPNQVQRWAALDVAIGKERLQGANCRLVSRVVKLGNDDYIIGDQKVTVPGWQALPVAEQRPR